MSREFSLVLLGAGLLTAGYFAWPEPDFDKRSEDQARQRVGGRTGGAHILFIGHFGGGSSSISGGGRMGPASVGSISRGGFGGIGGRVAGGGG